MQHHVISSEAGVTERVSVQVTNPLGPDSAAALQLDSLAVLEEAIRGNVSVFHLFSSQLVYHVSVADTFEDHVTYKVKVTFPCGTNELCMYSM